MPEAVNHAGIASASGFWVRLLVRASHAPAPNTRRLRDENFEFTEGVGHRTTAEFSGRFAELRIDVGHETGAAPQRRAWNYSITNPPEAATKRLKASTSAGVK